jgi:FADH2 O2-dependent halogenase
MSPLGNRLSPTTKRREIWEAIILGSGFAGSLLGWILAKRGWRVMIVDPGRHPRFAVGESSTPTADFLLSHLADRWGLSELAPLATWGSWKASYPDLICGKKRGFSYYRHFPNRPFVDTPAHDHSLLVAASSDDSTSDTHWLRSSVDAFIAARAVDSGVALSEESKLTQARFDPSDRIWDAIVTSPAGRRPLKTRWLIDASGGAAASATWTDNPVDQAWMRTRTRATFAHFEGVRPFAPLVCPRALFAGDDAAQHHLLDDGWVWMLRMDNGTTSVGIVRSASPTCRRRSLDAAQESSDAGRWWDELNAYPSLAESLANARRITPADSPIVTGRISRCRSRAAGPGWVMLPAAFGIVDPLHSTGIAHSLSGAARLAEILLGDGRRIPTALARYSRDLRTEVRWIDTLVAGCYRALPSFDRFTAFSAFYFLSTIGFERAMKRDPLHWPDGLLGCQDAGMVSAAEQAWNLVGDDSIDDRRYVESVRRLVAPWNSIGWLDPAHGNRYRHTAAPKAAVSLPPVP